MRHEDHAADVGRHRELAAVLAVAAAALLLLGPAAGGALEFPLPAGDAVVRSGDVDPAVLAIALLRTGGLLLAAHALLVGSLALLADLLHARPLARLARALAVGPVRGVVLRGTAATIGAGLLLAPAAAVAVPMFPQHGGAPAAAATRGAAAPLETARPLPPVARAVPLDPVATPAGTDGDPGTAVQPPGGGAGQDVRRWRTVTVRPGDHLWGLASRDVATHAGAAPDDAAVHRHWLAVVRANRDRLVVPDDPDLVLPDQQLVLPPVEER